ncbi:hypothetical protein JCM11641_003201 [Rhodosporidiobolus odoratus]
MLYASGANLHGQLQPGEQLQLPTPVLVSSFSSFIACSWSQLVSRDTTGTVHLHGLSLAPLDPPVDLEQVASWIGYDSFEAVLLNDGRIVRVSDGDRTVTRYTLACMNGKGELLVIPESNEIQALLYPSLNALFAAPSVPPLVLSLPSPSPPQDRFTCLVSGSAHFLLLTSPSQSLYSWGDDRYGQCGPVPPPPAPVSSHPRANQVTTTLPRLEFFNGLFPVTISCGAFHSAILTKDGSVYLFGSNKEGQLGLGSLGGVEPESLELPEEAGEVKQIACGGGYSVVLTEAGEVWAAGASAETHITLSTSLSLSDHDGQLGLSDLNPRTSFTRNDFFSSLSFPKHRITRIACSRSTTYIEVSNQTLS